MRPGADGLSDSTKGPRRGTKDLKTQGEEVKLNHRVHDLKRKGAGQSGRKTRNS